MKEPLAICFSVLYGAMLSSPALACAQYYSFDTKQKQSRHDCSFDGFGLAGVYAGHRVADLGGGKIGQLVVASQSCPYLEQLLFVDCTTAEDVVVDGVLDPKLQRRLDREGAVMQGGDYLIKYIQKPNGPIALTSEATVKSVAASARKHKLSYSESMLQSFAENNADLLEYAERSLNGYDDDDAMTVIQRAKQGSASKPFDIFCGCKVYYPNSPGAMQ